MSGLKQDFDKLYVDKLKSTGADLTKLINVINNEVVKKTVYDELDKKINVIDTSGVVKKQIGGMPSITGLATNAALNYVNY